MLAIIQRNQLWHKEYHMHQPTTFIEADTCIQIDQIREPGEKSKSIILDKTQKWLLTIVHIVADLAI